MNNDIIQLPSLPPNPRDFLGRKDLDATPLTERGEALAKAIESEVGYTQNVIMQMLPNVIIFTPAQYEDQKRFFHTVGPVQLYVTKHNIMEIEVKEP